MRTLCTDGERDEAAALVQDRQRWLTTRGLPVPARADISALFRDPQAKPAGLFEDGLLLACMIPQRGPHLRWGEGPCLFLGCVHTLPGSAYRSCGPRSWPAILSTLIRSPHSFIGSPTWDGICGDPASGSTMSESLASNSQQSVGLG
jgi:hypothetical protein